MFLSLLFLLMFGKSGYGENWVQYGTDNKDNVWSYDEDSLKPPRKNVVKVQSKIDFSTEGKEKYIQDNKDKKDRIKKYDKFLYYTFLSEINCLDLTIRFLSTTEYDTEGKVLGSHSYKQQNWVYIKPDSIMDGLREKVCNQTK
jgi:hypothetical protein